MYDKYIRKDKFWRAERGKMDLLEKILSSEYYDPKIVLITVKFFQHFAFISYYFETNLKIFKNQDRT